VRGRGGVRRSWGAREGRGEAEDGSKRAGTKDAFTTEDEFGVGAWGQSLAGMWLGARARGCSRDFKPLEEALWRRRGQSVRTTNYSDEWSG
jgi:hypothetical protein